jgi:DNA-binding protein YbaB
MVCRMRSQARTDLNAMLAEYRSLTERTQRLRDDLSSLTATRRSADGSACATVNAWGELVRLTFEPAIATRLDPSALATRIVEAAASAATEARARKQELVSELLPPRLRRLIGNDGAAGLRRLVGDDASGLPGWIDTPADDLTDGRGRR